MMKRAIFALVGLLAMAGCDSKQQDKNEAAAAPADNTKKNERDRDDKTLTPGDQGGSESDRNLTAEIRKGVVGADGLSMDAKNVKIITNEGVVTLRGPVKTADEKSKIATIAQGVAGVKKVDNQLEVAAN
jgi:hyperosmotically inducible protein